MFKFQLIFVIAIYFFLNYNLLIITKTFHLKTNLLTPLRSTLTLFTLGFIFRLTPHSQLIDLGFFLTDISTLFISLLFTLALFLGQVKYWKIHPKARG